MFTWLFKDASSGPPPNLHTCISLVEVYRFGQCLGRDSPTRQFTFLSCVLTRLAMRHNRGFSVGIPNVAYWTF